MAGEIADLRLGIDVFQHHQNGQVIADGRPAEIEAFRDLLAGDRRAFLHNINNLQLTGCQFDCRFPPLSGYYQALLRKRSTVGRFPLSFRRLNGNNIR
ncbi:hypothetical protein D3C75_994150 [compost metagenome]